MRYSIRWARTTTHSATVEISLAELAAWAATAAPVRGIADLSPATPDAGALEASLSRNHHLRERVLQLYSEAHDVVDVVEIHGPQILGVNEEAAPNNPSAPNQRKGRKVIGEAAHEDN